MGAVGIDLAGSPKRVTGLCYLEHDMYANVSRAHSDDEIIFFIDEHDVDVVAIDAPLSFPRLGSLRRCDEELRRAGIKVLPPALGGMRSLTERAIKLKGVLESRGHEVVEVFPTGARKILGLPSKREGADALRKALISHGVRGLPENVDQHILDAVICALVGLHYIEGDFVEFGDSREGVIIMPRPRSLE